MRNILFRIVFPSFFIFHFSFFIFPACAQTKDLMISGDKVSYDREKNLFEAEGSVEVTYKDIVLHGNHVIYNTESEELHAEQGFNLKYEGVLFKGESLDYDIKNKRGTAAKIRFAYNGIELAGGKIEIGSEKFIVRDASFTTCDLLKDQQHYRVSASEIVLYPKYGWLVAYWGFFWLGRFPIVPMPTYIYDMRAEEKAQRNLPPFPDFGSNDEDGTYINEKLAWHISRELSGSYSINYASRKGLGGGVEADYIVSESSKGNARFYGNPGDGLWGGITHRLLFGEEVEEQTKVPFTFFALPKHRQFELEAVLSSRERINYERVSFYPDLLLKLRKSEFFAETVSYDGELQLGMVREENNVSLGRGGGQFGLYWDLPEQIVGYLTPKLSIDSRFYSSGARWVKTAGGIDLRRNFGGSLSLGLGYSHYFLNSGQSPFNFEMYRFSSKDRFTSDLFFMVGETGVDIATSYFADTWQPEDIDYSLFFKLHCYNLTVKYRSLRAEFALGFSLRGE